MDLHCELSRRTQTRPSHPPVIMSVDWRPPSGMFALFTLMTPMIFGRGRIKRAWEPA